MALANDGKYYAKGGSGKQFVYNPATGNIGVTDANGKTTYVTTSDPAYQATLGAMNADTGSNFGGSSYEDIYNSAQAGYEAAKGNSVLQAQAATEAAGAAMNAGQPVNATPVSPTSTAPVNTPSNVPVGNNATVSIGGGRVVTPVSVGGSRVPSGNNAPAATPAVKPATTPAVAPATTPTTSITNNLGGNTRVEQAFGDTATGFTKNLIESSSPESTIIQLPTETATTPAAESGIASDGKYYAKGSTGKRFVYNPDTKNIGIMENGEWRYVMQGDDAYDATYAAMLADTGNMGGKLQGIVGEVVTEQQPADTIPTQQPVEPVMPQAPAAPEIYVPSIDDINDYDQLFGGYADTIVGTQNQQNAAIDAALAYQKYLLDQQRGSLAANKAAQDRDAYINYQRQINPYGYNAEALARMGLSNSGYSETALINYGNALMGAMQSNNISYYEGIQELERAKIEAQLEGDMNKAEIAADLQAQMAQTLLSLGQQKIQFEYQKYLNEQEAALNAEQMNLQRWMAELEMQAQQREADRDYELAQNELALKQQQINNDYAINQQKLQQEQAATGGKNPYASIVGDENIAALEEAVKKNNTNAMSGIIATIGLSNAADIITLLESVGVDNAFATAFAQGYLNRYYPTSNPAPSQNQAVNPSGTTGNNLILGADYDYVKAVEDSMANWQSILDTDPMGYEGNRSAMENAMVEAINNAPNAETKEALKSVAQKYGFI